MIASDEKKKAESTRISKIPEVIEAVSSYLLRVCSGLAIPFLTLSLLNASRIAAREAMPNALTKSTHAMARKFRAVLRWKVWCTDTFLGSVNLLDDDLECDGCAQSGYSDCSLEEVLMKFCDN